MKPVLLAALWLLSTTSVIAQESKPTTPAVSTAVSSVAPEKAVKIRHLLDLNGDTKAAMKAMQEALSVQKATSKDVPPAFWEKFTKSITEEDFILLALPIYDKHYTAEEIDGLIAFYESPLGKKVSAESGKIQTEAVAAGEALGLKKAQEVLAQLGPDALKKPAEAKKPTTTKRSSRRKR